MTQHSRFVAVCVLITCLVSSICFAGEIRSFKGNVKDEATKKTFLKFIDKNLGRTVKLDLTLPGNNPYYKISPKGTLYDEADNIILWNSDCENPSATPCFCEGLSFHFVGKKHRLIKRDPVMLMSGIFKIDKKTEWHQGIKCYGLSSNVP